MKEIPVLYKRKEECCGCTACYAICPKEAISMVEDEEGFEYPQIDESKCVRCYQCIKVCPIKAARAEYLIPIFIGELLSEGKMNVKVLKTNDTWYGMTYHEDVAAVKDSFKKMLEKGVYKADLFSDL